MKTENFDPNYPSYEEVQAAIAQAHVVRGQVMRTGVRKLTVALRGIFAGRSSGLTKLSRKHA